MEQKAESACFTGQCADVSRHSVDETV